MYRNQQEQKWAKFFDLLGIEYIHNPEQVKINDDFSYSPSFYLPTVDTSFMEKFKISKGVYFDVFGEKDYAHWLLKQMFPEPIVVGNQLPISRNEDAFSLTKEQLIDERYTLMQMFESFVIAEPAYHTMKQERWNESGNYYDKERMMIPFHEAFEADVAVV